MAIAASLAGATLLLLTGLWVSSALAQSSSALYYETGTSAGTLAIDKLNLSAPNTSTQVVKLGNVTVFGIALGGRYIYWSTETGLSDRGAIMRGTLNGQHVRRLVGGLTSPGSVIAVHGSVYWNDQSAIGRVALDGSHLERHFIDLPQENGGGVADGLASDGTHLYFSRCQGDTIGRADLNGSHIEEGFISVGQKRCPQGIAVAGRHIYWTQLGSGTIGRASLDGRNADGRWLKIRSDQGPFQVVADSAHVYWTWGGEAGSPSYTGRADADRSNLDLHFLAGSLYPMTLSGTGTSDECASAPRPGTERPGAPATARPSCSSKRSAQTSGASGKGPERCAGTRGALDPHADSVSGTYHLSYNRSEFSDSLATPRSRRRRHQPSTPPRFRSPDTAQRSPGAVPAASRKGRD
jgi:hypothetical protein